MNTVRLFLLTLLLALIPVAGFSYTDKQVVELKGNYYKVISAKQNTLAYLGTKDTNSGLLEIPGTIFDGKDVTFTVISAEYHGNYTSKNITAVKLPETFTSLEYGVFRNAKLQEINIPKNLSDIKDQAWTTLTSTPKFKVDAANQHYCNDADGALYSKDKTRLCAVPSQVTLNDGVYTVNESVTAIGRAAFLATAGLKKIIFPKNLKEISNGYPTIAPTATVAEFAIADGGSTPFTVKEGVLFKGSELVLYPRAKETTEYTVPSGIKSIISYAISNNWQMKNIDLNEITKLENSALYFAGNLTSITIPKGLNKFNATTKEGLTEGCFESCLKLEEYKVQTGNKDFAAEDGVLFSKDKKVLYFYPPSKAGETYAIPTSVDTIARRAFQGAKHITSMVIPKEVSSISHEAFREAKALQRLTFEEGSKVAELGFQAFRSCEKLKEVTLPAELKILNNAFYSSTELETINIPNGSKLKIINKDAFTTNIKLKAFNFLGSCTLESIGDNAFANLEELRMFNFPSSTSRIGANAFSGCKSMSTATFDANAVISKIGSGAFADCGLTSFDIPAKVYEIEKEAFRNCNALTVVNIGETTTNISPEAFKYCSKLTAINVAKSNAKYASVDGYLLSKDKETLVIFPAGKANSQFTLLPPSITTIGDYAFYDCKKLTNVTIPNKVKSIGKRAFGLCSDLNTITFLCDDMIDPAQINQVTNEMSFDDGSQAPKMFDKINIYVRNNKLAEYKGNDFYKKFRSISPSFIDGTEEYIAVSDNTVDLLSTSTTDHTFILPTTVTHEGIKYNVSLIGDYAFQNAASTVKEVVVKNNVKYIGAKAFITNIADNTSNVANVFFIESKPSSEMLATTRFELDETNNNYNEFAASTNIYVKKSAVEAYKKAWNKKVYDKASALEKESKFNFISQIDYRIKDFKISNKYATFAREFDTDFSDCYATKGKSQVAAFVAGKEIVEGTGDYKDATHHIRMTSIDLNGGLNTSNAYVPAETGVLLKLTGKSETATDNDFYYTIGENDDTAYEVTNNIMKGVTIKHRAIEVSSSSPVYVMQGGLFRKATSTIPANKFPIHRAYLKLDVPAGSKLGLLFDDSATTGIDIIESQNSNINANEFYNLNGQRVGNPQKGIYIQQGKKVIIK